MRLISEKLISDQGGAAFSKILFSKIRSSLSAFISEKVCVNLINQLLEIEQKQVTVDSRFSASSVCFSVRTMLYPDLKKTLAPAMTLVSGRKFLLMYSSALIIRSFRLR